MMRLVTQMVLALTVVEMVPPGTVQFEYATLPEAQNGRPIVREVDAYLGSLPVSPNILAPVRVEPERLGVATSAVSAVVVDAETNTILFEKNANEVRPVGSITKLMAAAAFLDTQPNLNQPAAILPEDVRLGGRDHLFIEDEVIIRDLLEASLVGSDNPATMSLMRLSGLDQDAFVERMNMLAREWGMEKSTFVEPTGLDSRNVSTAREVVLLLENVLQNETIQSITQKPQTTFRSVSGQEYSIPSTNTLLSTYLNQGPHKVLGGKTGFLPLAGYCLGVKVDDGSGHQVFTVALGAESKADRVQDVKAMTQWVYDVYQWPDEL